MDFNDLIGASFRGIDDCFRLDLNSIDDFSHSYGSIKKDRIIKNTDYNLNSPLLDTKVELCRDWIRSPNRRICQSKEFKKNVNCLREMLVDLNIPTSIIKSSDSHHKSITKIIYDKPENLTKLDLLKRWRLMWEYSRNPLEITEMLLTNNPNASSGVNYRERFNMLMGFNTFKERSHVEMIQFCNIHCLVCLMNSPSYKSFKSIAKHLFNKSKVIEVNGTSGCYVLNKTKDVVWLVTSEFLYHVGERIIIDKNFLMMLKDVCLARFVSCVSMFNRSDNKPGNDVIDVLTLLYQTGDDLLSKYGNKAYRVIKLLESECVERWNQLGNKERPLIPISTSLRDHLREQETKLHDDEGIDGYNFLSIIRAIKDPWVVGQVYGAYRHWGHPYIDSLTGLKKLHERVQKDLDIDEEFAEQLGSEMAFLVLEHKFKKERKWYCTSDGLPDDSAIKKAIDGGFWPTNKVIKDFGPNWHKLNLIPCFNIPEEIDPADMFSDKAHSITRSELINHIRNKPGWSIQGKRVMETLLETEIPSVKEFLERVERHGISREHLVIGLRAKERELKEDGRFFSLMGWELRLYFVITEYLIKKFYVPLFKGLTMADDLNTVTKKMLKASEGQGLRNYDKIYIANSLDYDKWNNNQRYESNQHVFRVMGKFIGLPEIFAKTHIFFQESLVYYCDRPDLMRVEDDQLVNLSDDYPVCWNGQKGGFEGLRQKGWSVCNYLILRRETMMRNTSTLILAQGDNQLIIPQYKPVNKIDLKSLKVEILNIWNNNKNLMDRIVKSTGALGLTINRDEVVTSSELLVYSKIPVYRGKVIGLETKRWSRVSSVTNDQIPSMANSVASAVTSAIAVCQYSDNPIEVMNQFSFFGCFVLSLSSYYNPIVGVDPFDWDQLTSKQKKIFVLRALYKDPSIGGVCGTNLMRFIISRFPDPICESLSWWKAIYTRSSDDIVKFLCLECGNPPIGSINIQTLTLLLEDPTSINIPGTLSSETLIKEQIYLGLAGRAKSGKIKNRALHEALLYMDNNKDSFISWLFTIRPVFPRFLSEFYSGTYFRITEGIVSTFQNSRTIRTVFSSEFEHCLQKVIWKSEKSTISMLKRRLKEFPPSFEWNCSATRADELREKSWGTRIEGATVPHPIEMVKEVNCGSCDGAHIVSKKGSLETFGLWARGPLMPYLGSKTSENTSVLQPWEKNIDVSLIRHACNLRRAIDWITDADTNLAKSIYNNIESLTGLNLTENGKTYLRTGSGIHRFRNSRVSNEGNPAVGFNNLMYAAITTDSLGEINHDNYDFMYQALICWAGILSTLPNNSLLMSDTTHFHISDYNCLRLISDEKLSAPTEYKFPDVSEHIKRMLASEIVVKTTQRHTIATNIVWSELDDKNKSWQLGRAQGFLWGLSLFDNSTEEMENVLFPISITNKVCVNEYMYGLHRGFLLSSVFDPLYTRYGSLDKKAKLKFQGTYWLIVDSALKRSRLPHLLNNKRFNKFTSHYGSDVVKSYPAKHKELVEVLRKWFLNQMFKDFNSENTWKTFPVLVFAEMDSDYVITMFRVAEKIIPVYKHERLRSKDLRLLSSSREIVRKLIDQKEEHISEENSKLLSKEINGDWLPPISITPLEARKAAGCITSIPEDYCYDLKVSTMVNSETGLGCDMVEIEYHPRDGVDYRYGVVSKLKVPRIRDPLISGKRLIQLSTGAHYKLKDLMCVTTLSGDGIFCGDGSGGMGACYLRMFPRRRVIFNSLFQLEGESMKGMSPQGPGAYMSSGDEVKGRCVNYDTCYQEPSDLRDSKTWDHFVLLVDKYKLKIGVICCDAEIIDDSVTDDIERNIVTYIEKLFTRKNSVLIYKTYWSRLTNPDSLIHQIKGFFESIFVCFPDTQGSHTSEVYIICCKLTKLKTTHSAVVSEKSMIAIYNLLKVNMGTKNEFLRAQTLTYHTMINGLELRAPFQGPIDVMEYLIGLGVKAGMGLQISTQLISMCVSGLHPLALVYILGFLISRAVIDVESWNKSVVSVPSSTKLQTLISAVFGLWFGVSDILGDSELYREVFQLYQKPVTVGFYSRRHKNKTYTAWTISDCGFSKIVDPGEKVGVCQTTIRLIISLYRGTWRRRTLCDSDTKIANKYIQQYSRKMTTSLIEERTGLILHKVQKPLIENSSFIFEEDICDA